MRLIAINDAEDPPQREATIKLGDRVKHIYAGDCVFTVVTVGATTRHLYEVQDIHNPKRRLKLCGYNLYKADDQPEQEPDKKPQGSRFRPGDVVTWDQGQVGTIIEHRPNDDCYLVKFRSGVQSLIKAARLQPDLNLQPGDRVRHAWRTQDEYIISTIGVTPQDLYTVHAADKPTHCYNYRGFNLIKVEAINAPAADSEEKPHLSTFTTTSADGKINVTPYVKFKAGDPVSWIGEDHTRHYGVIKAEVEPKNGKPQWRVRPTDNGDKPCAIFTTGEFGLRAEAFTIGDHVSFNMHGDRDPVHGIITGVDQGPEPTWRINITEGMWDRTTCYRYSKDLTKVGAPEKVNAPEFSVGDTVEFTRGERRYQGTLKSRIPGTDRWSISYHHKTGKGSTVKGERDLTKVPPCTFAVGDIVEFTYGGVSRQGKLTHRVDDDEKCWNVDYDIDLDRNIQGTLTLYEGEFTKTSERSEPKFKIGDIVCVGEMVTKVLDYGPGSNPFPYKLEEVPQKTSSKDLWSEITRRGVTKQGVGYGWYTEDAIRPFTLKAGNWVRLQTFDHLGAICQVSSMGDFGSIDVYIRDGILGPFYRKEYVLIGCSCHPQDPCNYNWDEDCCSSACKCN